MVKSIVPLGFCAALLGACAHGPSAEETRARDAERREADVLRERVGRLERRLSDIDAKLNLLAARLDTDASAAPAPAPRAPVSPVPPPPAPTKEEPPTIERGAAIDIERALDGELAEAPSPTPIITLEAPAEPDDGPPIVIDNRALARFDGSASSSRPPRSAKPAPPVEKKPTVAIPRGSPKVVYDWSMGRLEAGACDEAVLGFARLEAQAPRHHLADNALYWTAVCHQRMGHFDRAAALFAEVPLRYPTSNKLSDALFGLGEIHEARGDRALARAYYAEMLERFPDAEHAADARTALARLERPTPGEGGR